jgi:TonB family protein
MGSAQGPVISEVEQARIAPEFGAHTPLAEKLLAVAIRAQNFTGSSGVAIALTEGQEMVCRANWGTSAPEVGAKLSLEHSFTGLCARTGEPLRCDDAESDPRVDPEACRTLGISAIAVAPVRRGLKVIGVIAAFSDTPHAFTDKHLLILTTLSEVIVEILDDPHPVQPLGPAVEATPDLARAAAVAQAPVEPPLETEAVTTVAPEPAPPLAEAALVLEGVASAAVFELEAVSGRERPGAQRREREPAAEIPSPSAGPETKPVALPGIEPEPPAATASAAAQTAPALPQPPRPATTAPSKVSEHATPHHDASDLFEAPGKKKDDILPPAMPPGQPPRPTKTGAARDPGAARLTLVKQTATTSPADSSAAATLRFGGLEADSGPHRGWLLPAVVLAILLVIAIAGWRLYEARNAGTTKPAPAAEAPQPQATIAPEPEPAEAKPPEPASPQSKHSPFSPPPMADVVPPPVRVAPPPPDVTVAIGRSPVIEAAGPVRQPAATAASRTAQVPEAPAPQIVVPAPELPRALAGPTPIFVARPVSRLVPAQLSHRVEPPYPDAARRLQISSKVVLKATITKAGQVGEVKWVSGNDLFRDTAIAAVKQWRFKPASLNGEPVESDLEIVLQFKRPAAQ